MDWKGKGRGRWKVQGGSTFIMDQSENLTRYSDVVIPPFPTSRASRSATKTHTPPTPEL